MFSQYTSMEETCPELPGCAGAKPWTQTRRFIPSFLPIFHFCGRSSSLASFAKSQSPAGRYNLLKTHCGCCCVCILRLGRCTRVLALLLWSGGGLFMKSMRWGARHPVRLVCGSWQNNAGVYLVIFLVSLKMCFQSLSILCSRAFQVTEWKWMRWY